MKRTLLIAVAALAVVACSKPSPVDDQAANVTFALPAVQTDAEQHQCAGHDTMVQRLAAQGLRWNHTDNGDDVYTDGTTVVRIRDNGGIDCIVA